MTKNARILIVFLGLFNFILSGVVQPVEVVLPDVNNFFGERVSLSQPQSSKIGKLRLSVQLPTDYKLLVKANPQVHLFTLDGKFSKRISFKETSVVVPINREILSDKIYVELALYYCKQGKEGLCLIKKVLFDVPIQKGRKAEEFILNYQVPEVVK